MRLPQWRSFWESPCFAPHFIRRSGGANDEPVLAAWLNFRCRQALKIQGTKVTKEREVRLKSLTYMKITEFIGGFPARDEEAEHSKN